MKKRSLLLYDFLLVKGGAESLTLTLTDALDNLDIGVGFVDRICFNDLTLTPERLFELTTVTKILGWQSIKVSHAFCSHKTKFITQYEKVVFSGSNAPLAVRHRNSEGNILYCHTPPRYIYDLKNYYLSTIPRWQRPLLRLLIAYMQPKYEIALAKMNLIIANSKNVQARIKKYFGRDSIVIYPPCYIDYYQWQSQGDYYLSTARVEPYKRIKLLVEAFMSMPEKKLIVASGGSQLNELRVFAEGSKNIHFTGWCEKSQLQQLVGNCIATLYLPIDEDFGISPVESMAAGKPVIGVKEGGVKETVLDRITGLLCEADPCVSDVINAVSVMTPKFALSLRQNCQDRAQQFSATIFVDKMTKLLQCPPAQLQIVAKQIDAK